jgi:YidC/Oxa1 family membrane protein insertase
MNAIYDILGVPFGFVLKLFFDLVGTNGVSLILFTLFARLLMFPSSIGQQKGTAKTQRLQPKLRKIQEKYKGDNKKIQEETQALYSARVTTR